DDQVDDGVGDDVHAGLLSLHFTALRHQAGGDDVVVHRNGEAAFLGQDELEEIEDVPRIERRRVGADLGGEVRVADDRDAVLDDGAVGDAERCVAADAVGPAAGGEVDDH